MTEASILPSQLLHMLGTLGASPIRRCLPCRAQDDCHVLECRCISALLQRGSLTSQMLQQLAGWLPQYLVADRTPVKQAFARFLKDRPHLFFVSRTSANATVRVAPVTGKQGCWACARCWELPPPCHSSI